MTEKLYLPKGPKMGEGVVLAFDKGKSRFYSVEHIISEVLGISVHRQYQVLVQTTQLFTQPFNLVDRDSLDSIQYPIRVRRVLSRNVYFGNKTFITNLLLNSSRTSLETRKLLLDIFIKDVNMMARLGKKLKGVKTVEPTPELGKLYSIREVLEFCGSTNAHFSHTLTQTVKIKGEKFTNLEGVVNLLTKKPETELGKWVIKFIASNFDTLETYVPNIQVNITNL